MHYKNGKLLIDWSSLTGRRVWSSKIPANRTIWTKNFLNTAIERCSNQQTGLIKVFLNRRLCGCRSNATAPSGPTAAGRQGRGPGTRRRLNRPSSHVLLSVESNATWPRRRRSLADYEAAFAAAATRGPDRPSRVGDGWGEKSGVVPLRLVVLGIPVRSVFPFLGVDREIDFLSLFVFLP